MSPDVARLLRLMGKQSPCVMSHEVGALRREIARLERENQCLHLEAIRSCEAATTAEKGHKETIHCLTQELSREKHVTDQLMRKLKVLEQSTQVLTRRYEEATTKLARTDAAYRQRLTITDPVGPAPTPLQYDAAQRRVLSIPEAGNPDAKLLQTLQLVEDQRAALQKQNEALEHRCSKLQEEVSILSQKVIVREEELQKWTENLEGNTKTVEAVMAKHQEEDNQLAMRSLQEQIQFLHLQLEQTDGYLQRKTEECALLAERYDELHTQMQQMQLNQLTPAHPSKSKEPRTSPPLPPPPPPPAAAVAPTSTPAPAPPVVQPAAPSCPATCPVTPTQPVTAASAPALCEQQQNLLSDNLLKRLTEQVQEARAKEATLLEENRQLSMSSEALRRQAQQVTKLLQEEKEKFMASMQQSQKVWEEQQSQVLAEVSKLQQELSVALAERDQAVAQAQELQQNMNIFNEHMDQFGMAFEVMVEKQKALQATVLDLEGRLAAEHHQLEAVLQDKASLETLLADERQRSSDLQAQLEAAYQTQQADHLQVQQGLMAEAQSTELQAEIHRLQKELQQRTAELQHARQALHELDEQRDVLQLQCDEQRAALRALEHAQSTTAKEHSQLQSLIASLEAHSQQQGWQLRERELLSGQEQERAQLSAAEINRLQQEKEELGARLLEATQDLTALQGSHALLTAQLDQAAVEREGMKNDLHSAMTKLIDGDRLIKAKDQQLAEMVQAYRMLQDEGEGLKATLHRTQRELQTAQNISQTSETTLAACRAKNAAAETDIMRLLADVNTLQQQNATLARQVMDYAQTVEQLVAEMERLKGNIHSCEEILRQRESDLLSVRKECAIHQNEAAMMQQAAKEASDKCLALEMLVREGQQKVRSLEEVLKDLRLQECRAADSAGQHALEIQNLKHYIQTLEMQKEQSLNRETDAFSKLQETSLHVEELQRRCLVLELETQQQAVQVARLQQRNAELQQKVEAQTHLIQTMDPLLRG